MRGKHGSYHRGWGSIVAREQLHSDGQQDQANPEHCGCHRPRFVDS